MRSAVLVVLLLSCAAAFLVSSVAGAEAPSSSEDVCMNLVIADLMPCFEYAQQGSNLTKPSKDCCKGLASFLSKGPGCICTLLGDASSLGENYGVNVTRVENIPSLCKIDAKLDRCTVPGVAQGPSAAIAVGSSAAPSGAAGVPGGAAAPPPASEASTIWVSSGALVAALTATAAFAML